MTAVIVTTPDQLRAIIAESVREAVAAATAKQRVNATDLAAELGVSAPGQPRKEKPMQSETMKFDPATGEPRPYPSHAEQWRRWHGYGCAWLFNPWSGERRDARDVGSDTNGRLIAPHGTLGSDLGVAGVPDNTANTRLDDTAAAIDAAKGESNG